jgi:hypothetical protein
MPYALSAQAFSHNPVMALKTVCQIHGEGFSPLLLKTAPAFMKVKYCWLKKPSAGVVLLRLSAIRSTV